jgi:hypothetical protein
MPEIIDLIGSSDDEEPQPSLNRLRTDASGGSGDASCAGALSLEEGGGGDCPIELSDDSDDGEEFLTLAELSASAQTVVASTAPEPAPALAPIVITPMPADAASILPKAESKRVPAAPVGHFEACWLEQLGHFRFALWCPFRFVLLSAPNTHSNESAARLPFCPNHMLTSGTFFSRVSC